MASDAMGKVFTIGALGVGGYFVYKYFFETPAAVATTPASTAVAAAQPVSAAAASPTTQTFTSAAPSTLDGYYSAMVAAANADKQPSTLTPDQWNYYLAQVMGSAAPDPLAVFTQQGFDRNQTMTSAVYWGSMAPYLKQTRGLSGLGIFGGLGQLARAVR